MCVLQQLNYIKEKHDYEVERLNRRIGELEEFRNKLDDKSGVATKKMNKQLVS